MTKQQPPISSLFENPLDVTGAYGRDNPEADWTNNRDVHIVNGPYCSIRDLDFLKRNGYTCIRFFKRDGSFTKKEIS